MIRLQTPNSPVTPRQSGGRKTRCRIVLVCHGSTTSIAEGQLSSTIDDQLNMLGIIQSQKTSELLLDLRVNLILCGPQAACIKTAAAIEQVQESADCLGVDCVPRYVEVKVIEELGDHSWKLLMDQLENQPSQHKKWQGYLKQHLPKLDESLGTFWGRMGKAWDILTEYLKKSEEDMSNIVVVGPEIVHIAMLCHCLGLEKSHVGSFNLDTGSISVIDFPDGPSGKGVIRCLNYTAHLGRWAIPVTSPSIADEEF